MGASVTKIYCGAAVEVRNAKNGQHHLDHSWHWRSMPSTVLTTKSPSFSIELYLSIPPLLVGQNESLIHATSKFSCTTYLNFYPWLLSCFSRKIDRWTDLLCHRNRPSIVPTISRSWDVGPAWQCPSSWQRPSSPRLAWDHDKLC